ncbi:MAG: MFS transporter [Gammaproteobacteria bacterium]|nr:MFS transporter [Gammaproteobacteria bacterium]
MATDAQGPGLRSGGAGFLAFLTFLNVINFVDRQLLASFANWIVPELGLTNTQFGLLTGLVFIFFYSVMGLFMGTLVDRMNRTRLIAGGVGLWSGLTAVSGMAQGFLSLALPRVFIGVGESILTPAAMSLFGDRYPARWLGVATGIYGLGVPIGIASSLFIVAYLEPILGWRGCFYALGAIGVVLAAAMWFVKETPRVQRRAAQTSSAPSFRELMLGLLSVLRHSPSLSMTVLGAVSFTLLLGASAFEQLWFVRERGFDRSEIAEISAWYAIFGGIIGTLVGGYGGDIFMRRTGIGRPMFLFWIMLVLAPFNVALRIVEPDSLLFWAGVFFIYFQLGVFYGPTFATVQELTPPRMRGTVVAFCILMLQMFGAAAGATVAGLVIEMLQSSGVPEPYTRTLLAFTFVSMASIPLFFFAGRRFRRDRDALSAREGVSEPQAGSV